MKWLDRFKAASKLPRVYVIKRTPEQEAMWQEQLRIRDDLGFIRDNDAQNWLRMHQILQDHDKRLKALENKDG